MRYKFCYKLSRVFCNIISDRLDEATHRFLVIRRNAPIALHQHFLLICQLSNWHRGPHPRDHVKDVEAHSVQGFQISTVRAPLVALIAALGIPGYASDLRHFFLFQAQTTSFLSQAFACTQIWEFSR